MRVSDVGCRIWRVRSSNSNWSWGGEKSERRRNEPKPLLEEVNNRDEKEGGEE